MRLLTMKLYRAFPELDGYNDDQCRMFVHAAREGLLPGFGRLVLVLVVTLPTLLLGLLATIWLAERWRIFDHPLGLDSLTWHFAAFLPAAAFLLLSGPVAGYLVRDLSLRRRLLFVLRVSGVCPSCGYSVIGLPVISTTEGGSSVRCPECGVQFPVDQSLAVLAREPASDTPFAVDAQQHPA
jgi:predicted RNA-binding Zn-ribbon protein involved in translation (DUF1610 family)